jgi:hypothetical protein
MSEAGAPTQPTTPTPALRIALGVAAVAAVGGWIRAVVGFSGGDISLPLLYSVTACAAVLAVVRSRAVVTIAVAATAILGVAVADGIDPGGRRRAEGTGTLSDPDGLMWMRLPAGWVEDSNARPKPEREGYWVRKWVPAAYDISASPQLEVQVLRTTNCSWDQLKALPGIVEQEAIARGPARGMAWRIEANGEGQSGLELHYGGRRVFVRFKSALGTRPSGQAFEELRPELEAVLDSVTVPHPGWFRSIDAALFGG